MCIQKLKSSEKAKSFFQLREMNGWTDDQVAKAVGVSPSTVSGLLDLLRLPDDLIAEVDAGKLAVTKSDLNKGWRVFWRM